MKLKFSSFSILTCFACICIIGGSIIPLLSVQLNPTKELPSLNVSFLWHDVSAKIIEQEVTSKLEGVFSTVNGIKEISSYTEKEGGNIDIKFKKNADLDAVRFEIANLIRQSYSNLPEGVSYPQISISGANENNSPILVYSINANESPYLIKKYAANNIIPKLSRIKGVNKAYVYGADPFEWVIKYNSQKLAQLSISVMEIEDAVREYFQKQELGNASFISKDSIKERLAISISLTNKLDGDLNLAGIPIKKIAQRIIYLKNVADIEYRESPMKAYFRINGQNSINMAVYAENGANAIDVAKKAKNVLQSLQKEIKSTYSLKLINDSTEYIVRELQKIQEKMVFSLLFLFILILVIAKSAKYIIVLLFSIAVNLLAAVIFYYLFKVELQLYSFAGITISFGMIIDNCIIMIDHIRNKGDKKVFLAILATTLTTAGALFSTFFLKESQQANLHDFCFVIAINIGVSLFVSLFFVPAIMQKMQLVDRKKYFSRVRKRRVISFTSHYQNLIAAFNKFNFKAVLIFLLILGFGLPVNLLPEKIDSDAPLADIYNTAMGNVWFCNEVKPVLEKIIGGSLRLFTENVYEKSYYSDPERTTLRVTGSMPEGCTIEQLNDVVAKMESYISGFKEVEMFETQIMSYDNSMISIYFKKDYEYSGFPFALKSQLESKAISLGGLDWTVSGVGQGFSNSLGSDFRNNRIELEGYNYDKLYQYAEVLKNQILTNSSRISGVDIVSGNSEKKLNSNDFFLDFNAQRMALNAVSQIDFYEYLKRQSHSGGIASFVHNNELQQVKLMSDQYQKFNVWDLKHLPIVIANNQYKLDQMASIEKKSIGNSISKKNQQYRLAVVYNFMGTELLGKKVREENISEFKGKLPLGYRVFEKTSGDWDKKDKSQYYFIFIVISIIFFICCILLESLRQPLAIISMIPIAFIGVFLVFYLFDLNFDQGGYASFILLCGISVNSALYIINDYNNLRKEHPYKSTESLYYKAFNSKIIPVLLTIISTMGGLIPFVWEGQNEAFWFSFAAGSIGGLIFSLLGIFVYLPLFIVKNTKKLNHANTII